MSQHPLSGSEGWTDFCVACHAWVCFACPSVVCSAASKISKKISAVHHVVFCNVNLERLQVRRQFLIFKVINSHYKGMVFVAMPPSVFWTSAWPLLLFVGQVPGFGLGITKLMLPRHLSWGDAMAKNMFLAGAAATVQPCVAF